MKSAVITPSAWNVKDTPASSRLAFSLLMRTGLFFFFGLCIVGLFAAAGHEHPLQAAERWWPFQAILANIASFLFLRSWIRREGGSYRSMFRVEKGQVGAHVRQFFLLLVVGFVLGGASLYAASYVFLGSWMPPETMFQPLPLWAAILALVAFPLTNSLVETPTYIGYALPRLQQKLHSVWIAAVLVGLALAFQHVALPIVADVPYMLWRFAAFIPLAIALGFIYTRTKKLLPIVLVHGIMDLQLVATQFLYSA